MGYRTPNTTFQVRLFVYEHDKICTPVMNERHYEEILQDNPDAKFKDEYVTFMYWDFDLKCRIEIEATTVHQETQMHYINPILKRQLKWKYLLRDWTLTEEDGRKINVEFDETRRVLHPNFYNSVLNGHNAINPMILDAIMMKADKILEFGMSEEEANALDPKELIQKIGKKRKKNT